MHSYQKAEAKHFPTVALQFKINHARSDLTGSNMSPIFFLGIKISNEGLKRRAGQQSSFARYIAMVKRLKGMEFGSVVTFAATGQLIHSYFFFF